MENILEKPLMLELVRYARWGKEKKSIVYSQFNFILFSIDLNEA